MPTAEQPSPLRPRARASGADQAPPALDAAVRARRGGALGVAVRARRGGQHSTRRCALGAEVHARSGGARSVWQPALGVAACTRRERPCRVRGPRASPTRPSSAAGVPADVTASSAHGRRERGCCTPRARRHAPRSTDSPGGRAPGRRAARRDRCRRGGREPGACRRGRRLRGMRWVEGLRGRRGVSGTRWLGRPRRPWPGTWPGRRRAAAARWCASAPRPRSRRSP